MEVAVKMTRDLVALVVTDGALEVLVGVSPELVLVASLMSGGDLLAGHTGVAIHRLGHLILAVAQGEVGRVGVVALDDPRSVAGSANGGRAVAAARGAAIAVRWARGATS